MFTFNHWYILFVGNKIIKEVVGVILSTWLVFIFIFIFFRFPISLSSSFFSPCADFPKQCELDFDFLDEGRCQEIAMKTQDDWVVCSFFYFNGERKTHTFIIESKNPTFLGNENKK